MDHSVLKISPWISGLPSFALPHSSLSADAIASLSHPLQWHLALLICIYMPLLCGLWAAEIDQQFPGLLHISLKSDCHTQQDNVYECERAGVHVCVVYFHACIHARTLETWLKDKTHTSTSDVAPYGRRARIFWMKPAFTVVFQRSRCLHLLILHTELTD